MRGAEESDDRRTAQSGEALAAYCANLNEKSKQGKIDILVGRDLEIGWRPALLASSRATVGAAR